MLTTMKRVKSPDDIPQEPHYAVLVYNTSSIYVEGDERSRTHPGHGYPAHYDTYESFKHYVTDDKQVLLDFTNTLKDKKYAILHVAQKLKVITKTEIQLS